MYFHGFMSAGITLYSHEDCVVLTMPNGHITTDDCSSSNYHVCRPKCYPTFDGCIYGFNEASAFRYDKAYVLEKIKPTTKENCWEACYANPLCAYWSVNYDYGNCRLIPSGIFDMNLPGEPASSSARGDVYCHPPGKLLLLYSAVFSCIQLLQFCCCFKVIVFIHLR